MNKEKFTKSKFNINLTFGLFKTATFVIIILQKINI